MAEEKVDSSSKLKLRGLEALKNLVEQDVEAYLDAYYKQLPAYRKGYLPRDRQKINAWGSTVLGTVRTRKKEGKSKQWKKSVVEMGELIDANGVVRMYVLEMIDETPEKHRMFHSVHELLSMLNEIITEAPRWNPDDGYAGAYPLSILFAYPMMTIAGQALFRDPDYNWAIIKVLREWGEFLSSEASCYVLNKQDGWLSKSAWKPNRMDQFIFPDPKDKYGGWKSYNEFFYRKIKPEIAPVIEPNNEKVINSTNQGIVYNLQRNVKRSDKFWIKSQPYSLVNMLDNAKYVDEFVGGDVYQSFLNLGDYHRMCCPVNGELVHLNHVKRGLTFSLTPYRGFDPTGGTYSQGYISSLNIRVIFLIKADNPQIGHLAVISIGSADISSVVLLCKEGDKLKKGDEMCAFQYGGSTLCICFRPGVVKEFLVEIPDPNRKDPDTGPRVQVNQKLAITY